MQNNPKDSKPLGFWMCTSLIVGNVIGMGIYLMPSSLAPFGANAFLGWGVTVVGCLFIAITFANFARLLPGEDGPYGYTRRAFGNGAAFFVMWCYWVSIWATNATIAVGVVGYLTPLVPALGTTPMLAPAAALALIWFFVLVNASGARVSGGVQVVSTLIKLLPMLAAMALGLWVLMTDAPAYSGHLAAVPFGVEGMAAAGTIALFSMLGVECATIPAGKVERAAITIPRATMAGTLFAALVYIAVTGVTLLLIPHAQMAQSTAPFVDLFNRYAGANSGKWLGVFVLVSGVGAINGWTMISGEVTASFANHGVFPAKFGVHNGRGAPVYGLLLVGLMASAVVLMNYSRSLAGGYTFLILIVTAANLPMYVICGLAMIKLARRGVVADPDGSTGKLIFCAAAATVFSLWSCYGIGEEATLWSIALGALSLPVFYGMRRRTAQGIAAMKAVP
ncbi:MAG: amino acid permease [Pseudomonadota bacterium]